MDPRVFFRVLFGNVLEANGTVVLSEAFSTSDGATSVRRLRTFQIPEDIESIAEFANGIDCYFGVHVFKDPANIGRESELLSLTCLCIDVDAAKGDKYDCREHVLNNLRHLPLEPTFLVQSDGDNGGFHLYYVFTTALLASDENKALVAELNKGLHQAIRQKCSIRCDQPAIATKLLRPPGSIRKSGRVVGIIDSGRTYDVDELLEAFPYVEPEPVRQVFYDQPPRYSSSDEPIEKYLDASNITLESFLLELGWTRREQANGAHQWTRPGSSSGHHSGVEYFQNGIVGLTIHTSGIDELQQFGWYPVNRLFVAFRFGNDWQEAAEWCKEQLDRMDASNLAGFDISELIANLKQPARPTTPDPTPAIAGNWSGLPANDVLANARVVEDEEFDEDDIDEVFRRWVPRTGMIKEVACRIYEVMRRPNWMFSLAASMSFCSALFGRRIMSPTGLRTNDYTIIAGPSGCGKESVLSEIQNLVFLARPESRFIPGSSIQSGNGLLAAITESPNCFWISDEAGKVLAGLMDPKAAKFQKDIANLLLELYGRSSSTFAGCSHASGRKNKIIQPCLSFLGFTTPSGIANLFQPEGVEDGTLGRFSVFSLPERLPLVQRVQSQPDSLLVSSIAAWLEFMPSNGINVLESPNPVVIQWEDGARDRWEAYEREIDSRQECEAELAAAAMTRSAARALKLAMTVAAGRVYLPSVESLEAARITFDDVEWAIKIADYLANASRGMIDRHVTKELENAVAHVLRRLQSKAGEWVSLRDLYRGSKFTAGDIKRSIQHLDTAIETRNCGKYKPSIQCRITPSSAT